MSLELYIKFDDQNWFVSNSNQVRQIIENLDSYASKKGDNEFWLKNDPSDGGWSFDVRLFFQKDSLLLEVSSTTQAYFRDIKNLLTFLNQLTTVELVDEDGDEIII